MPATALGKSASMHDLSVLAGPLRSHGGRHEQIVPIVVSHPLSPYTPNATASAPKTRNPRSRAEWESSKP
jgi:phosphonoacetate hydrolase